MAFAEFLFREFAKPQVGGKVDGLVGVEAAVEARVVPVRESDDELSGPLNVPGVSLAIRLLMDLELGQLALECVGVH